jgi:hypothetical protein
VIRCQLPPPSAARDNWEPHSCVICGGNGGVGGWKARTGVGKKELGKGVDSTWTESRVRVKARGLLLQPILRKLNIMASRYVDFFVSTQLLGCFFSFVLFCRFPYICEVYFFSFLLFSALCVVGASHHKYTHFFLALAHTTPLLMQKDRHKDTYYSYPGTHMDTCMQS